MNTLRLLQKGLLTLMIACGLFSCGLQKQQTPLPKEIQVNFNRPLSSIDGFGVNITPAQWRDAKLKPTIDMLADDLGATLFRLDCFGMADWLDPARRQPNGSWPESYLDSVYSSKVFANAWETFRYLTHKGVEPFFNITGPIRPGLGKPGEPNTLADFDGYAEMVVTLLQWAREKEGLKFRFFAPFNETDYGNHEGPKINEKDMITATRAIIKKLDAHGLTDINIIALDDTNPILSRLETLLSDSSYANRIQAFGTHTYGDFDIGDWNERDFARFSKTIKSSNPFKNVSIWLTEYGDLDQTGEMEYEFAWRITRRLMKCLNNGVNAGIVWDAFDNFHAQDTTWSTYGLLKTDTVNWTYTPKKRYYAAKQVYSFVKPGWKIIQITYPQPTKYDIYKKYHDSFRQIRILTFVSPDSNDYTMVIMNDVESDVNLSINLNDIGNVALSKTVHHLITDKTDNCSPKKDLEVKNHTIRVLLPEHSISTITTLR